MPGFERRGELLHCDGVSLEDIAREFSTPLYVYSRDVLLASYDAYPAAFAPVAHRVCYSLKANSCGAILRLLAERGASADALSEGELRAALRAGFPPSRIVLSGVGKTDDELQLGLAEGVSGFIVESEGELRRLASLADRRSCRARLALRVTPDIDSGSHPYITTGTKQSKFGVGISHAADLVHLAATLPSLQVTGLQCHIGSQILDLGALAAATNALVGLSRALLADGIPLESLDIGGGLGLDYVTGAHPDPRSLAERVLPLVEGLGVTLLLEPGRSIVGPSGVLLTRVLDVKENGGRRFAVVDAGMNDLLRPALYGAFHRIEPARQRSGAAIPVDVAGPVCESSDFLGRDRQLPGLQVGDLLVVRDAGAYGYAMSSNYNLRRRPAEVLVAEGSPRLVRERETFEDLFAAER